MNKRVVMIFATMGMLAGSYLPVLLGDHDMLSGWSILGGIIGGFFGIWLAIWLNKRYG